MYLDTFSVNDHVKLHDYYPYNVMKRLERPAIDFSGITILYGSNGSGKSSLLNLIAGKIHCKRFAEYVENEMWVSEQEPFHGDWINRKVFPMNEALASVDVSFKSTSYEEKRIITMDDILRTIEMEKEYNHYMSSKGDQMQEECRSYRKMKYADLLDENGRFDLAKMKTMREARSKHTSLKRYVDKKIEDRREVNSNGETVLKFYEDNLLRRGLYLLDEPENCLSTEYQLRLKEFIEYSVRYKECQFVIATHSPIFLSLTDARVYNLDSVPVHTEAWYSLPNVKAYYKFFKDHEKCFEEDDSEYLTDMEYDYLLMWFDYNDGTDEFFRLNHDELLLKKAFMVHMKNKKLTPKKIVDFVRSTIYG